jgi:hypothetical protein
MGKTKAALQTAVVTAGLLLPGPQAPGAQAVGWAAWGCVLLAWAFLLLFAARNRYLVLGGPAPKLTGSPPRGGTPG